MVSWLDLRQRALQRVTEAAEELSAALVLAFSYRSSSITPEA